MTSRHEVPWAVASRGASRGEDNLALIAARPLLCFATQLVGLDSPVLVMLVVTSDLSLFFSLGSRLASCIADGFFFSVFSRFFSSIVYRHSGYWPLARAAAQPGKPAA